MLKKKAKSFLGILLIVVGCLGLLLPILPGWWVILIGIEILGWRLVINTKSAWKDMIKFETKLEKETDQPKETID